ncbi:unnamed protein product [Timema podura]|uniref:Uncharacterized protein n=1 Tax=Timema podura TaxID=61482 RepID=A0ABN7PFL5_TIMPD|nr:unnamed protein product [Timema podura]
MENSVDRESYSLAAGLALGLVVLGKGSQLCGLGDLAIPDTLHYYMVGGHRRPLTGSQKEKYKSPSYQIREGSQKEKYKSPSYQIREGDSVNIECDQSRCYSGSRNDVF